MRVPQHISAHVRSSLHAQEGRWGWAIVAAEAVAGAAASAGASIGEAVGELASLIRREDGEGEPGDGKPKLGVSSGSPLPKAYVHGGCRHALCMHGVSCSNMVEELVVLPGLPITQVQSRQRRAGAHQKWDAFDS